VLAGAAILTPAFYFHSLVLLIPAFRLAAQSPTVPSVQTVSDVIEPTLTT